MELETQAAFDPASFEHIPVLLNECLEGLSIDPAGTYLDGTAGGAGHSRQIALRLDAEKGRQADLAGSGPGRGADRACPPCGPPATVVQINFRYAGQALESLASTRSTARCWIWAFPAISWTMRPAAFPTVRMHRWTCG